MQRFWLLAVFCAAQFVEVAAFAEDLPKAAAPKTAAVSEESRPMIAAARRRRRRQPRRRPPGKRRRGGKRRGGGRGPKLAKTAVKANAGIVSGLEGIDDIVPTFGADYVMPLGKSKNLNIVAGLGFWYHDIQTELVGTRISVLTPGAGAGYLMGLGPGMWVEGTARFVYAMFSTTVNIVDAAGVLAETSQSLSSAGLFIGGSFHYDIGGMAVGPEVQYPIYFDDAFEGVSAINLLLFLEFQL